MIRGWDGWDTPKNGARGAYPQLPRARICSGVEQGVGRIGRFIQSSWFPQHPRCPPRMKRAFKYDAAISATEFDALGVDELSRRLQQRIGKTIYATPRNGDKPQTAATLAAAKRVIEKEARVVIVFFQRLWGTGATAHDAAALKTRIGKLKRKDVVVVPLDNAPIPGWLKGTVVRASGSPASSAVVDAIVSAVVATGGASKRQTDAAV